MKIWCDGGNNKRGEYCVITEKGKKYKHIERRSTNNTMEYKAMLKALEIARNGDIIYSDSQLVVYQLLGFWQVKQEHLKRLWQSCKEILKTKKVRIWWLPRSRNRAGKELTKSKRGN